MLYINPNSKDKLSSVIYLTTYGKYVMTGNKITYYPNKNFNTCTK